MQGSQKLNNKRQDVFINLFQNAEPGMLSCVHVIIDTDSFQEDMIELPQSGKLLDILFFSIFQNLFRSETSNDKTFQT